MSQVKHITRIEPETEWRQDALGFATRTRAIVAGVAGNAAGSVASFLWLHWVAGVLVIGSGVFTLTTILIFRHYRLQRMNTDNRLHEFCHYTRDEFFEICAFERKDAAKAVLSLERFHQKTVERGAAFFRELTGDATVNCGIRIAETVEGVDCYVTKARSDGLDGIARKRHSQPIPADKGLASALRSKDFEGVFMIGDITEAIDAGVWLRTHNDQLPDAKTLMVAPVNGYEAGCKVMCGIFYVTSRNATFKPAHTIPLKAIVDFLGLAYPIMIGKINQLNTPKIPRVSKKPGKTKITPAQDESRSEPEC